jgi:hypothetical protein
VTTASPLASLTLFGSFALAVGGRTLARKSRRFCCTSDLGADGFERPVWRIPATGQGLPNGLRSMNL